MRALFPASYPWIMWPSRRFLWEPPWSSGPQHCNTRAFVLSLYYQFLWLRQASLAPLTIEGHLWACRSLLSVWVPSHSENWAIRSPELCDRLFYLLFELALLPSPWGSPMSMPLPSERLSSLSCWNLSSPFSRAVIQQPQVVRPLYASLLGCSPCW